VFVVFVVVVVWRRAGSVTNFLVDRVVVVVFVVVVDGVFVVVVDGVFATSRD
jgi:hypothetical protein